MLRVVGRDACRSSRSLARRYYSIPTTSKQPPSPNPLTPTPHPKKPKVDLRPAPIKPITKSIPNHILLTKSDNHPHLSSETLNATPKLAEAKQEIQQHIHDAEAHGILTPPPPDANWFKRTLHTAIQLFKFYFRGVKLIFTRRNEIALIKERIAAGGTPLTRAEFCLIQTQKDDIKKVVPFLVFAILLEEVIPLIAIYVPSLLPSTCILPSQRQRIDEKRAEKARSAAVEHRHIYAELRRLENPTGYLSIDRLRLPGASTAFCRLLGLSTIGIDFLRIRRIKRHLDFITIDDRLLFRHDAVEDLSNQELKETLEERGFLTKGLSRKDLQSRLSWWLESVQTVKKEPSDSGIARRLALIISSR